MGGGAVSYAGFLIYSVREYAADNYKFKDKSIAKTPYTSYIHNYGTHVLLSICDTEEAVRQGNRLG